MIMKTKEHYVHSDLITVDLIKVACFVKNENNVCNIKSR